MLDHAAFELLRPSFSAILYITLIYSQNNTALRVKTKEAILYEW